MVCVLITYSCLLHKTILTQSLTLLLLIHVHENISVTFLFLMGGRYSIDTLKKNYKLKSSIILSFLHKICISEGILHFRLIGMAILLLVL